MLYQPTSEGNRASGFVESRVGDTVVLCLRGEMSTLEFDLGITGIADGQAYVRSSQGLPQRIVNDVLRVVQVRLNWLAPKRRISAHATGPLEPGVQADRGPGEQRKPGSSGSLGLGYQALLTCLWTCAVVG